MQTLKEHKSFGGTQGVYRHVSAATGTEMDVAIYVPPQAKHGPVPVLVYLSGLTCTWENVVTKGGFQAYAAQHGLMVVAPDTSPRGCNFPGEDDSYDFGSGAGFYVDATVAPWSQAYRMYSYVVEDLPALIATHFPGDLKRLGVFGHSMGGHGALVVALRNPQLFRSVSAFAPIVAPSQCPWGRKAFSGYLGPDRATWMQYDATELVRTSEWRTEILIDQGTKDEFLDEQLKPQLFMSASEQSAVPVRLRLQEGYDHSYYFISTFMGDHVEHHARLLKG
mgnify:CR=1 FL=1|jgi:S-formylglutathione hydrolase